MVQSSVGPGRVAGVSPVVALLIALLPGGPLLAQPPQTNPSMAPPVPAPPPVPNRPAGQEPAAERERIKAMEDRLKANAALPAGAPLRHGRPEPMDLQEALAVPVAEMLETRVAVSVRHAPVQSLVKAVQTSGFPLRVDVRQVPPVPITLSVQDATAESVLIAAALLSKSELFVFRDHLLITQRARLTEEEKAYVRTHADDQISLLAETPQEALDAAREKLLATPVSIDVRKASMEDIARAVEDAGFPQPIEVRKMVEPVPFQVTLAVKAIPAKNMLMAVAELARRQVFVFDDHLLIARTGSLTDAEKEYAKNHPARRLGGDLGTQRGMAFMEQRSERMEVLTRTLGEALKREGKDKMMLGDLNPSTQQVAQRLNSLYRGNLRLSPETEILFLTGTDFEGKAADYAWKITNRSQNARMQFIQRTLGTSFSVTTGSARPIGP